MYFRLFKILLAFFVLSNAYAAERKILFVGDSLTEGYGVQREESYPFLIQSMLDAKFGKDKFKVVNGSVSGSTSASAMSRLNWFKKSEAEILVLALGANDGLRGIKPDETKKNLITAIEKAKEFKMKVLLLGMMMPPNYGPEYTKDFQKIYTDIAKSQKIEFLPFLLDGVAGEIQMNQDDGIHPNSKGHEKMAESVFQKLEKML